MFTVLRTHADGLTPTRRHSDNEMHEHAPTYLLPCRQIILFALIICISPNVCAGEERIMISPQDRAQLKKFVAVCIEWSVDCTDRLHAPIGDWDLSRVADMSDMFIDATWFNGDLSKWDVSRVTRMEYMFSSAINFQTDISKWNMSRVVSTSGMFQYAILFNGNISTWDVSSVRIMDYMFDHAHFFNGNISKWDVSSVNNMDYMFYNAKAFNGDVSKWNVGSVASMNYMFYGASAFNGVLCGRAWRHSNALKARSFVGSSGYISYRTCAELTTTSATTTPTIKKTCPVCSTFKKSDQFSCCAPGGAWFSKCGGTLRGVSEHTWMEGVDACKGKLTACRLR